MEINKPAPIVLFLYNRIDHTQSVLDSLVKNDLCSESDLFIYIDGPKDNGFIIQESLYNLCLNYKSNFNQVVIRKSEKNKGLAASIIDGVTEIVSIYGRVIVLEDDLVLSPSFLHYMNNALEVYENEARVDHISAYWYPHERNVDLPETFFYRASSCWGWGTWKRSWSKLNTNSEDLLKKIVDAERTSEFNIDDGYNFLSHLEMNINGTLNTWAIKWYASVFLRGGLCLHPRQSYVENIGHDGSGEHCKQDSIYSGSSLNQSPSVKFTDIVESELAINIVKDFFYKKPKRRTMKSVIKKVLLKLKRMLT